MPRPRWIIYANYGIMKIYLKCTWYNFIQNYHICIHQSFIHSPVNHSRNHSNTIINCILLIENISIWFNYDCVNVSSLVSQHLFRHSDHSVSAPSRWETVTPSLTGWVHTQNDPCRQRYGATHVTMLMTQDIIKRKCRHREIHRSSVFDQWKQWRTSKNPYCTGPPVR